MLRLRRSVVIAQAEEVDVLHTATLETLSVCVTALAAIRTAVSVPQLLRPSFPGPLVWTCAWQQHSLGLIAGCTTIAYAAAGGSRAVLISALAIQVMGACAAIALGSVGESRA